jgi:hypothetical protein
MINMDRNSLNFWTDIAIFFSFIACFSTGILKLPIWVTKLGFSYSTFNIISTVHDWAGVALGVFSLLHIILHWRWIVAMAKTKLGIKGGKNENSG